MKVCQSKESLGVGNAATSEKKAKQGPMRVQIKSPDQNQIASRSSMLQNKREDPMLSNLG